jgi:hypothetical protein
MIIRFVAAAALGLTLLAPSGAAQTATGQLQKAIYLQDAAGSPPASTSASMNST